MEQKPILIMGAMDCEIEYLISKIENCKCNNDSIYNFYEGTIDGYPVILVKTGIGLIEASAATVIAIEKYNPLAILNEGTAGACSTQIHKKDIVIGENCINLNSYQTPYKNQGEGSNSLEWNLINFATGENNKSLCLNADSNLLELAKKIDYSYGNVHFGTIGSSYIWNREVDRITMLNKKFNVICEEMESIAVYSIANKYKIPVIGIRVISDNEILKEEYERDLGIKSQEFVYKLVKSIIDWRSN